MDYAQELISRYKEFLISQGVSTNTLKNYASDLRTFITFLGSQNLYLSPDNLTQLTSEEKIKEYENYLSRINPSATVNRRISSLRKFISFSIQSGLAAPRPPVTPAAPIPVTPPAAPVPYNPPPFHPAPIPPPSPVQPVPAYPAAPVSSTPPQPFTTPISQYEPPVVSPAPQAVTHQLPSDLPPPPAQHPSYPTPSLRYEEPDPKPDHPTWTPLPPSVKPAPVSDASHSYPQVRHAEPIQPVHSDAIHTIKETPTADLVRMIPHIFPDSTFTPPSHRRNSPALLIVVAVISFALAFLFSWLALSSDQTASKDLFSLSKVFNQQQSESRSASGLLDPTRTSLSQ